MVEHIGARVKRLRTALQISQAELANAAGVTPSAISQLEKELIDNPRPLTLLHIARALGTTMEDLVDPPKHATGERTRLYPRVLSNDAYEFARWFDAMSDQDRYKLIGAMLTHGPAVRDDRMARLLHASARKLESKKG